MAGSQSPLSGVHSTAIAAAAMRGAHLLCGAEPKIFRDELALPLADMTEEEAIKFASRIGQTPAPWVLRSRFAEDRLSAARKRVDQYVVLGAGLDSYALRFGERLGELNVFEVDDPPFQDWKRRRIEALGLPLPRQLHFAPCDFEHMSLPQALAGVGFKDAEPCFASWLGVTQYLTGEAITQTLRWAAARPCGSEIVLSFVTPGERAEGLRRGAAQMGIDFSSFFSPDEMTQILRDAGFRQIEHLPPAKADEIYFGERSDGLRAPDYEVLVSATT
jgi:methyltransferase (TIGR00027 family)